MSDFARRAIVRSALRLGEIAREEMRAFMERQGIIMAGNERKPFSEIVEEFEVAARDRAFGHPVLNAARASVFAALIDRSVKPEDVVVHGLTVGEVRGTQIGDTVNLLSAGLREPHITVENVPIHNFDRLAVYSLILRKETNRKPHEVEYSAKCVTDVADRMLEAERDSCRAAVTPMQPRPIIKIVGIEPRSFRLERCGGEGNTDALAAGSNVLLAARNLRLELFDVPMVDVVRPGRKYTLTIQEEL